MLSCRPSANNIDGANWSEYLGGPDRNHFSLLRQIDSTNVGKLKMAWQYHTGDSGQMQCNPLIVDGTLYGVTALAKPFALNAATGQLIWKTELPRSEVANTPRGLVYWKKDDDERILFSCGEWLYALDPKTGNRISNFGDSGSINIKAGLGESAKDKAVISNAPGTVFNDIIIVPTRIDEGEGAAPGHIQAFNIVSGKLEWVFHTIPQPGEEGADTWPPDISNNHNVGAANNWCGMAIDREKGIVYVPTGSAAFDFYGAERIGSNLFANCLLALDARTGKKIWHQQLVHHDILDRDLPAPPNLVTLSIDGKRVDAVAQITKQGYIFVFDRQNGKPLFPVVEQPAPPSDIPGERAWPTQPFPLKPAPFTRTTMKEEDIYSKASNRDELVEKFRTVRSEGVFTPLSEKGTIVFPGLDGGAEWGGAAVDDSGVLYVNSNETPWLISLGKKEDKEAKLTGAGVYRSNCAVCHSTDRKGSPSAGFPSLVDIGKRRTDEEMMSTISHGKGRMPAFPQLSADAKKALVEFLKNEKPSDHRLEEEGPVPSKSEMEKYTITSLKKFVDDKGYPAISPPWGTLNAIDLNSGEYRWRIPFGEYPELSEAVHGKTGAESYGGPVVTASGLLIIAGTKDEKIRIFNSSNGTLIWEMQLPAAGFATPSTYMVHGKQYVVIACGGNKLGAKGGDSYVAFCLQ